jgi:hypothetical protein
VDTKELDDLLFQYESLYGYFIHNTKKSEWVFKAKSDISLSSNDLEKIVMLIKNLNQYANG